jgi:hypothetical protein
MAGSGLGTFSTHPPRCGRAAVTECDERVKRAVVASRLTTGRLTHILPAESGGLSLRRSDERLRAELPVRRCDQMGAV